MINFEKIMELVVSPCMTCGNAKLSCLCVRGVSASPLCGVRAWRVRTRDRARSATCQELGTDDL